MFTVFDIDYITDMHNKLVTRDIEVSPFGFQTESEEEFRFTIQNHYEWLYEELELVSGFFIPVGIYRWWNYEVQFFTNPSRPISFELKGDFGDYYDGTRNGIDTGLVFRFNKYLGFSTDIVYNKMNITSRDLETKEYNLRLFASLSTRLSSKTFIQWNNETEELNLNFRLRYIPQIGSDVYFVYNHLWDGTQNYKTSYNENIVKIAYLLSF